MSGWVNSLSGWQAVMFAGAAWLALAVIFGLILGPILHSLDDEEDDPWTR